MADSHDDAVASPHPALWASMPSDCLGSILLCVNMSELSALHRTCTTWRSVLGKYSHRGGGKELLLQRCHDIHRAEQSLSPLRASVTRVVSPKHSLDYARITELRFAFTNLHALECSLSLTSDAPPSFPTSLRKLSLLVVPSKVEADEAALVSEGWTYVRLLLSQIAAIGSNLESLHVSIDPNEDGALDHGIVPFDLITALLPLAPTLRELSFHEWYMCDDVDIEELEYLRHIHKFVNLTALSLKGDSYRPAELKALAACSFAPSLRRLKFSSTFVEEDMGESIQKFTSLEEWSTDETSMHEVAFLKGLPNLTHIHLHCHPSLPVSEVVSTLQACKQTTKLWLKHAFLTEKDLTQILSHHINLTDLTIVVMVRVEGLRFLTDVPHLRISLQSLALSECRKVPPSEVERLFDLSALRRLDLELICPKDRPPSTEVMAKLDPRSSTFAQDKLPELKQYRYYPGASE